MVSERSKFIAPQQRQTLNPTSPIPAPLHAQRLCFAWAASALRPALSEVSLDIQAGEMFGLLGPNGAGKTTLISLIAGLIQPDSGELAVMGYNTRRHANEARSQLGFVFQSVSLDRFMTVEDNLHFAAGLQGLNKAQTRAQLARLHAVFPIEPWLKKPVGSLSGGQKRLVDIARALIHQPQVLILDEPTTALDVPSKNKVWETLKALQNREQITILVATHLMDEASGCDRVGFLNQGQLTWVGTPHQALDELPDQRVSTVRTTTLADWFVWKMNGDKPNHAG
jgi:ABC-type multidrug transport system ATPase subunit